MTSGIYILYYPTDDGQYYIGKSVHIEQRYREHCSNLRNNTHCNKALLKGFITWGMPNIYTLEELPINNTILYEREVCWINLFNSYHQGMNEVPGGEGSGIGEEHNQALFTKSQYVKVLEYLTIQPPIPFEKIAITTKPNLSVVKNISMQNSHLWLKEEYKELWEKYTQIKSLGYRRIRINQGLEIPQVVSPEGLIYSVPRITLFAKEHNLQAPNLSKVISKERISHKGWKLYV